MGEGDELDEPTYPLGRIQGLVKARRYSVTGEARTALFVLKWEEQDMVDCVLALQPGDFYKSMPSTQMRGTWQDVYKPTYLNVPLYVKLRLGDNADAIIIQFKGRH